MKRLVFLTSLLVIFAILQINAANGDVAYIYDSDEDAAKSFNLLLEEQDIPVTMIPFSKVAGTDFSFYQAIIVGSDTGKWENTEAVKWLIKSEKPIIGIGRGGSWLFDQIDLFVSWGHSWLANANGVYVVDQSNPIFNYPNEISIDKEFGISYLYSEAVETLSLHAPEPPSDVTLFGRQIDDKAHYPLSIEKNRYFLWGFTGSPDLMNDNGRSLFLNVVEHFLARPADVAYVYSSDIGGARSYRSLLNSNGIPTALISMHIVHLVNFSKYKVIIVGADTGNLNSWGNPAAIEAIKNSPRPVIGNGEGGYAFFGKLNLSIGYPHGWHGSNTSIFAVDLLHSVFNYPNDIPIPKSRVLDLYLRTGHVGIYLPIKSPDVTPLGREVGDNEHYPILLEKDKYLFWGFGGAPNVMFNVGRDLFINAVNYFLRYRILQTRSIWASTVPTIDGVVSPGEWNDAKTQDAWVPLWHGRMYVKNDDQKLYLLADLTGDTQNDPPLSSAPWGDFFWLTFDVDSDMTIVSGKDVNYATIPGTYNLGLQHYLGPGSWTGLKTTTSSLGAGFGSSLDSGTNHRIWEISISLDEIETSIEDWLDDPEMITPIRSGIRTYSQNPPFDDYNPSYFPNNFSNLIEIFPALGPTPVIPGTYIFRGVGAIPETEIDSDGYATTVPGYHPYVTDAPFGGALRVFGNFDYLRSQSVNYYRIWYQQIDVSPLPDTAQLKQSWVNYRWEKIDSTTYKWVPHDITYDDVGALEDVYEIPPSSEDWYFDKLLILWSSWRFRDGRYKIWLEAFDDTGSSVSLPAELNEMVLMLDNTVPHVEINAITHGSEEVGRCDIVYLDDAPDGLRFNITAWDDRVGETYVPKHLLSYSLVAHYGDNESVPIYSDNYGSHENEHGSNLWGGVQNLVIPSGNSWRPPESCAYQFRLSVWSRRTNGYSHRSHYNEYNKHVTILFGETTPCENLGDVSGDGIITAYDALLILQYVAGLISEFPASSQQSPANALQKDYSVSIPEISARIGDRIEVPIAINDTTELTAGGFVVKYDPSIVRAVDFSASSLLNGSYWKANIERTGEVRFAFATAEPTPGKGELIKVKFEVLPNNSGKESPVVFDKADLFNALNVTKTDGLITILPETSALLPNYPNPFNPETWIPYQLANDTNVKINIYNVKGQIIRILSLGQKQAGTYFVKDKAAYWDAKDELGQKVASGIYYYTLHTEEFRATRKMVILK